jgi:hypothetical protein
MIGEGTSFRGGIMIGGGGALIGGPSGRVGLCGVGRGGLLSGGEPGGGLGDLSLRRMCDLLQSAYVEGAE